VDNAGPGLGSLVRNLDILNKVTIPRLNGVEQMLITYPDVVSGGFSVVRNDSGVMRAHFGLVLNSDDPHACISGYRSTASTPSPGAVATTDTRNVACDVINGVDPNPSDGVNENGADIRGEQNIGRSGGVGSGGPQSGLTSGTGALGGSNPLTDALNGLMNASPFSSTAG
jgi:phospholipid/cholesterol/gamma-HCH transport system substrate-binding protein